MIMQYYPQILSLMDKIDKWNEDLNEWAGGHLDNVGVGTAVVGLIFVIAAWGINTLGKK